MKHKSEDLKLAAVRYHLSRETSCPETAEIFGTSVRTLKRWIERYRAEGSIKRHNRVSCAYKVRQVHVDSAIQKISGQKQITMNRLLAAIKTEFPDFQITRRHLNNVLRDKNLSRKRIRREHRPQTRRGVEIDQETEKALFFQQIGRFDLDKIICIDETSMQVGMKSNYGRSKIGRRCRVRSTDNRVFQKHTLIGAVSATGIEKYELYPRGGMTSERFMDFLQSLLQNKQGYLVVMDNAPVHRKREIKTFIESSGNTLLYSLANQPECNAIESWFSQMKHYVKELIPSSFEEIASGVIHALTQIRPQNYLNIFKYAYRREELQLPPRTRPRRRRAKNYL